MSSTDFFKEEILVGWITTCGCGVVVALEPSKLAARVRLPPSAL